MRVTVFTVATCLALAPALVSADSKPERLPDPTATKDAFIASPPTDGGPVVVRASFHLRDINDIDDEAETFEFEGVLELTWRDPREAFDPEEAGVDEKVYVGAYQVNEVFSAWFPQVVLVNESGLYEKHGSVLRVRPDGTISLLETLNAVAEADLRLRRYPFDKQCLTAVFEVFGSDVTEVVLNAESEAQRSLNESVQTPEWTLLDVDTSVRERKASYAGRAGIGSALVVSMNVERESFFMIRLVVLPLVLIVMLSWSVFWMHSSSLGDRMSVSFIGILTAVAYQIVVSEILPQIAYMTVMHGFLNLSLIIMCATVVINLWVDKMDQAGKPEAGNRVDRRCRSLFPVTYFGLNLVMIAIAFVFF